MTTAEETYDFIVTGAGSAGCAVAGRLSESGKHRVLLLEAGGRDSNPWIHIPLGYTKTFTNPRVNWMFESEPEKELNNRTLYQPRGKVLGGTSSINGMVYMRGTSTDYDGWRQRGCEGWDWDSVLPFFKKAEDQERGAGRVPRRRAARCTCRTRCARRSATRWSQASIEAGIPANNDFNGARQEGVGYYQTTTANRRRWSSARAYLGQARHRREPDDRDRRARHPHPVRRRPRGRRRVPHPGRAQERAGARRDRRLRRRLRLAAAAAAVRDRPGRSLGANSAFRWCARWPAVGANLHDHFNTYLVWRCTQKVTVNDMAMSPARKLQAAMQYATSRSGHLSNAGIYAGALVRTDPRLEQPDLQINMSGWSALERLRTGIKPHPFSAFTFSPVHLRPDGRGTVRIKSPDPLAPPAIQFNFLASDADFQALIYGMRLEPQDRGAAGAAAVRGRGGIARPRSRERSRHEGGDPGARRLQPAPGRHLPHGAGIGCGGRPAPAGARGRAAARRRRLDHAAGPRRQHQRALDHDRRKMRRDDPRRRAGGLARIIHEGLAAAQ